MSHPTDQGQYVVQKDDGRDFLRSSESSLAFAEDEKSMNAFYLPSVPTRTKEHKVRRIRSSTSVRSLRDYNPSAELPPPMPKLPLGLQHTDSNHFNATGGRSAGVVEARPSSEISASLRRVNMFKPFEAEQLTLEHPPQYDMARFTSPYIEPSSGASIDSANPEDFHSGIQNALDLSARTSSMQHPLSNTGAVPRKYTGSPLPPAPVPPRPRSTNQNSASSALPMVSTFGSIPSPPVQPISPPPPLPFRPEYLRAQVSVYQGSDDDIHNIVNGVQLMKMSSDDISALNRGYSEDYGTQTSRMKTQQEFERNRPYTNNSQMNSFYHSPTISPSPRFTSLNQEYARTGSGHESPWLQTHANHQNIENSQWGKPSPYPSPPMHHPVRTYSEPALNDFVANPHTYEPTMWSGQNYYYSQNYIPYSPPSAPPSFGYYNPQGQFESPPGSPPYSYYPPNQTYYPNTSPSAVYYPSSPSPYTPYTPPPLPPTEHKHHGMRARIGKYLSKGLGDLSGQILDDDVQNDLN